MRPIHSTFYLVSGFLFACTAVIFGCSSESVSPPAIVPRHFKVEVPFLLTSRGIIINTYWGAKRTHHVLCLDNYSPSWIREGAIQYDNSFVRLKKQTFKTTTADGTPVAGEVGLCDSLRFEDLTFLNAPFYVMPAQADGKENDDGVVGSELMAQGIWKIDFRSSVLTFTSTIDSLPGMNATEVFPASFTEGSIELGVKFSNDVEQSIGIDLGFNGDFLLPADAFKNVSGQRKSFTETKKFSTPASWNIVNVTTTLDTVQIGHNWYFAFVSTSDTVKERLLGLQFFRRFDYVIFDFINERVYLPKKVW
ncbi:MAG: hypothetical protein V4725_14360 [Bacteroidota bacterium]